MFPIQLLPPGYRSPLHRFDKDDNTHTNVDGLVKYLMKKHADTRKFVLNIQIYGEVYVLKQLSDTGVNAEATDHIGTMHNVHLVVFRFITMLLFCYFIRIHIENVSILPISLDW